MLRDLRAAVCSLLFARPCAAWQIRSVDQAFPFSPREKGPEGRMRVRDGCDRAHSRRSAARSPASVSKADPRPYLAVPSPLRRTLTPVPLPGSFLAWQPPAIVQCTMAFGARRSARGRSQASPLTPTGEGANSMTMPAIWAVDDDRSVRFVSGVAASLPSPTGRGVGGEGSVAVGVAGRTDLCVDRAKKQHAAKFGAHRRRFDSFHSAEPSPQPVARLVPRLATPGHRAMHDGVRCDAICHGQIASIAPHPGGRGSKQHG